ncbi:response regulator transcription factor [Sphingobacterium athyrii]|uniref:DNA-binding response regulator n=1 Tax=Sphingobacterium athyrii TaxID=2152717 RepID=A0A363NU04_9SPHI|nr:response regulator transcription factor [Sphingobacterium athyrii]PUV24230.1 DNA-binding response regulator [Sphingobacterium athyrii]
MNKIKVLLAEDEPMMGKLIKEALELRDFEVIWAVDGLKAFSSFCVVRPDICIFDVMMPYKDGFTLAQEVRGLTSEVPIIFLTAKSAIQDLATGFEVGANDYIKKPFSMEELIIRMHALLNRRSSLKRTESPTAEEYAIGKYHFNFKNLHLTIGNKQQQLSYREAQLLKLLVDHQDAVLDRKVALDYVWGDDSYFNSRSMDVFISKLRKFLEGDPTIKIVNIRGKGFKLVIA